MKANRLSQKLHKWLGLLVGIQLVIWSISGFYMVVINIDIIHGDHLVQPTVELSANDIRVFSNQLSTLVNSTPDAHSITLKSFNTGGVVEISAQAETFLLELGTSKRLRPIEQNAVSELAVSYYTGSSPIEAIRLIEKDPPREIGARPLPLWKVDFADAWGTSLYISPTSGALVTRRHTLWRVFDFLWMLHIMDYDERADVNNTILRAISMLAFLLVLSGIWYLYFRLKMNPLLNERSK